MKIMQRHSKGMRLNTKMLENFRTLTVQEILGDIFKNTS